GGGRTGGWRRAARGRPSRRPPGYAAGFPGAGARSTATPSSPRSPPTPTASSTPRWARMTSSLVPFVEDDAHLRAQLLDHVLALGVGDLAVVLQRLSLVAQAARGQHRDDQRLHVVGADLQNLVRLLERRRPALLPSRVFRLLDERVGVARFGGGTIPLVGLHRRFAPGDERAPRAGAIDALLGLGEHLRR